MFFKSIKPKKLKDKQIQRKIRNAVLRVGRGIQRDFEKSVATWDHKPVFTFSRDLSHDPIGFFVGTVDTVFRWVDEGTGTGKEENPDSGWYLITPVRAKALKYQEDFFPKTFPGRIGSNTGGKSGDNVFRDYTFHPGIEARGFTTIIREKWRPKFRKEILEAIKSGIRESGHAI